VVRVIRNKDWVHFPFESEGMASRRKMDSIGDFYYDKKEILGHGAFAIVFKGWKKQVRLPSAPIIMGGPINTVLFSNTNCGYYSASNLVIIMVTAPSGPHAN